MGLEGVLQRLREGKWLGHRRFSLDTPPLAWPQESGSGVQTSASPFGACEWAHGSEGRERLLG